MAPSTAIFISLPSPFLKVINCNHLHLCYGVLVVGSMLRCTCWRCITRQLPMGNIYGCETLSMSVLLIIHYLVKEESSLPKCYQLQPFGSVLRCTCSWIFVMVYLLEIYYYHLSFVLR